MKKFRYLLSVICLTVIFYSCDDSGTDPIDEPNERGALVEVKSNIILNRTIIQLALLNFASDATTEFFPEYEVEIVSIVYKTIDPKGSIVNASGVIVIPNKEGESPLISLHHGTQTNRNNVGSNDFTYAFDGIIAASTGYVASVPDYLGLGVSNMYHPYLHEETSASSSIDMLLATKEYCEEHDISISNNLFLTGFSQGGYVTMAAHKEVEANYTDRFNVIASAPMAGPHDLLGTAMYITQNDNYPRPSFISFLAFAYNNIYEWNKLGEIFKSPYDQSIPVLFDGSLSSWEIDDQLPKNLTHLFNEEFIDGLQNNSLDYMRDELIQNSVLDWSPIAPITIIHGDADTFVPFQNAITARSNLLLNGATSVELITIEGGDHGSSILPSIEYTLNWFNSLRGDGLRKLKLTNSTLTLSKY